MKDELNIYSPPVIIGVIVVTIVVVSLLVAEPKKDREVPPALAEAVPAAVADAGTIEPAAITAWQRAAASRNIDLSAYTPVYVQDSRTYSVLLAPRESVSGLPAYEITIERGSNRVLDFSTGP